MPEKMLVRLRILHGKLKKKDGRQSTMDVAIKRSPFVIGSGEDCSMRCKSSSVSAHHCEILRDSRRVMLRILDAEASTLVNGEAVRDERVLRAGDKLQVGRMDFEVLIKQPETDALASTLDEFETDAAGEEFSDLLLAADQRDRDFRASHPEVRQMELDSKNNEPDVAKSEEPAEPGKKGKKTGKEKPGTLPKVPEQTSEDSTDAAQQALRKMFSP